jgi:hypothetical protein
MITKTGFYSKIEQKTASAEAESGFCYLLQEDMGYVWRRERDSNPRTHYTTTPLAEEPLIATWVSLQDNGSPSRTRTCDNSINSRVLYQLSYQGK